MILRRRMMVTSNGFPTPIYELSSPTSVVNYDTGVKLFDPAISFTILCEANFTNRNWSGKQSLFATGDDNQFRVGYISDSYNYANGEPAASTSYFYTTLVMNNLNSDPSKVKSGSLLARFSNTTKQVRRIAIRYDTTTLKVYGFSDYSVKFHAPISSRWWCLSNNISSASTIKLNANNPSDSPTINIFRVYDSLLTDTQINNFLDKVIN